MSMTVLDKYVVGSRNGRVRDEKLMFKILNRMYHPARFRDHERPEWLLNPLTGQRLELDRYYPDLKLAFEYNGRHHLGKYQRYKDGVKRQLCRGRGIALVVIKSARELNSSAIYRLVQAQQKALEDRAV